MQNNSASLDAKQLISDFVEMFGALQDALCHQIAATEVELKQVKSLMDGAIDDLVDSFISLEATTRIGQNLVKQMASDVTDSKDELNPFKDKQLKSAQLLEETSQALNQLAKDVKENHVTCAMLAGKDSTANTKTALGTLEASSSQISLEVKAVVSKINAVMAENKATIQMVADEIALTSSQIEKDVQTAVKSLQFQDMTTQLIVQCGERMKVMQEMLNSVRNISDNSTSSSDLQTKLADIKNIIKQAGKVRMKEFNVDAGSVELF